MTLDEWTRLVVEALRRTRDVEAAQLLLAAAGTVGHDLDGYDVTELVGQWVTVALDPGGVHQLVGDGARKVPAHYRLHGLEVEAAHRGVG